MPHRRTLTRLSIALSPIDLRVYSRAARILARIMGKQAPAAGALLQAQLGGRDPTGVADDYLDSIRWPLPQGRVIASRLSRRKPREAVPPTSESRQLSHSLPGPPLDPKPKLSLRRAA